MQQFYKQVKENFDSKLMAFLSLGFVLLSGHSPILNAHPLSHIKSTIYADTIIYGYGEVDEKPKFSGGDAEIMAFINRTFIYPPEAKANRVQGMMIVGFIIEKNGKLSNIEVLRGQNLGYGLPQEAVRVVKAMPKWEPGREAGKRVRVKFTVPISCKIDTNQKIYNISEVTKKPEFPGGRDKMFDFLLKEYEFPHAAKSLKTKKVVIIRFVVNTDGSLMDFSVYQGNDYGMGLPEEAMRVCKMMPDWTPGEMNGTPVKVEVFVPLVSYTSNSR